MRIHRPPTLLAAVCLIVIGLCPASQAQNVTASPDSLERELSLLDQQRLPGPLVATLESAGISTQPPGPASSRDSLEALAERHGLKLFVEDGVYVIGPAERLDFSALFDGRIAPEQSAEALLVALIASLTPEQVRAMGSPQGLSFGMLNKDQQAMLKALFSPPRVVAPVSTSPSSQSGESLPAPIPAESIPLSTLKLHGWLEVSRVEILAYEPGQSSDQGRRLGGDHLQTPASEALRLIEAAELSDTSNDPEYLKRRQIAMRKTSVTPGIAVRNTLKESHLDYSLPDLQKPMSLRGKVSISSLVEVVRKETGVKLNASPGCEAVCVYISATDVPAGRLLKAVSLATCGTWRRFGEEYIFTMDLIGIGQIAARLRELRPNSEAFVVTTLISWLTPESESNPVRHLPLRPSVGFALLSGQLSSLLAATESIEGVRGLPWAALTPEQQAFAEGRADHQEVHDDTYKAEPDRSRWHIMPHIRTRLAFSSPGIGTFAPSGRMAQLMMNLEVFPPSDDLATIGRLWSDVPADYVLPVNKQVRAYIHKPERKDSVRSLISDLRQNGFNVLVLQVFADGYTAFPSKQFPMMEGLDADYVQNVISAAHEKGIRVLAGVDVLRWSDGSRKHWVTTQPDVLDYDVNGLTHAEWSRSWSPSYLAATMVDFVFGDSLTGDVVSPFSPKVRTMLKELLGELASYDFDGIVLDQMSMAHPEGPEDIATGLYSGSPGHHPLARQAFFAKYRADSVDVGTGPLEALPMQPVVRACSALDSAWRKSYRDAATDLCAYLLKEWTNSHSDGAVWVTANFGTETTVDWTKLRGLATAVLLPGMDHNSEGEFNGIRAFPVLRASDSAGTMLFYGLLARALGKQVVGVLRELNYVQWKTDGIVFDFSNVNLKKNAYLRIIAPPDGG